MHESIILETKNVSKRFGGVQALNDVNLKVYRGEILGLIGPNGAGKTTLFNIIAGTYPPTSGRIFFKGRDISKYKTHRTIKLGIGRTFQIVQIYQNLTVLENVLTGALYGSNNSITYDFGVKKSMEALEFIGMSKYAHRNMNSLVLTDRKKIELARALATDPELLLLDEIIAGLNPSETSDFMEIIQKVNNELNITVIVVEHVMRAVMNISHRIFVLNYGQQIAEGSPIEIAENPNVIEAYLGQETQDVI